MPKISVIIPVYNGEQTIQETIDSVLAQTFSDFELIVINDGSTDATLEIVTSIQDPRVKLFSYPNRGLSHSRNRGLTHARSDLVAFLDADDLWTADKLEAQRNALQANPQATVAYSWTDFIDEFGQSLGQGIHVTKNGHVLADLLENNFIVNGSNVLIHQDALISVGGFDESFVSAEDWDLWLRLAASYQFVCVPAAQVLYRRTNYSMSANLPKLEAEALRALERAYSAAPDSLHYLKRHSLARFYKYLTQRALQELPGRREYLLGRQRGFVAARFLYHAVRNDPSLLRRVRFMLPLLFKIIATLLLPPQQAPKLITKIESIFKKRHKIDK
ncbi:MAG: glycosyltransferase [Ardenticatenaceae bacterium]